MVSGARYVYLALVWLYLVGIVVQVFLAGMGLFGAARDFEPHIGLGWLLHLVPILLLVAAAVAKVGRRLIWWTVALLVVQFVHRSADIVRLLVGLALTIGVMAWRLVRQPAVEAA